MRSVLGFAALDSTTFTAKSQLKSFLDCVNRSRSVGQAESLRLRHHEPEA